MRRSQHQSVRNQASSTQASDIDHKLPWIINNVEASNDSISFSTNTWLLPQLSDSLSLGLFDPLQSHFSAVDYLRDHIFQLEKVTFSKSFSSLISRNYHLPAILLRILVDDWRPFGTSTKTAHSSDSSFEPSLSRTRLAGEITSWRFKSLCSKEKVTSFL